jgi:transglutaminase-like putative cysteine protease
MIYDVSHKTLYRYSAPVAQSHHLMHLAPRPVAHQTTLHHSLLIEPAPTSHKEFIDSFGNPVSILEIDDDHSELVIHARSTIEVRSPSRADLRSSAPWSQVHTLLTQTNRPLDLAILQFIPASRHTRPTPTIAAYADASFPAGRPVLEAAMDLVARIYDDFTFDATATDVSTPISQVLANRRGVCQDFSHLALACLRHMRIPARYVSGYLLTRPPAGQTKLKGVDASHAWISVWAPEAGWVDFDPTNNVIPSTDHVTIAWGRDYDDVSPIGGVLLGGGKHSVSVSVDVSEAG